MIEDKTEQIARARKLWSEGAKRKYIAKAVGFSEKWVSNHCKDLPKPIEHRGRQRPKKLSRRFAGGYVDTRSLD